ncbi:multidrug and toxin extrusion protein 1-like isoform X2 [Poeciliopsis prolifica]|uniref:multidrug and toxin extrusion protein 1-like isoform X2 n=2 Tax=Poeciliopsis prolifica TaxID=188132 RepID=UPI002413A263|nr:multidrug and toxin extrusion protein 1-like isoform X2 [Poeciliopsis prolifica]
MDASSDRLFCCRWVRNKVPTACRDELYHILRMTGPLLLSKILHYLLPFVVTMFCGRLGNDVMAGYGLASSVINVTTAATGCGLGLACDTLVSQTFGGKNLLRVGVILQRGIIILMLFCLPCWGLLINAEAILLCMGQEPEVARVAQLYITAFIPAVPAMFLYNLQVSYLQNQGIIMPQMYTALLANIANLATNFTFLHWMNLGVVGSAAANTLSQIYICVFLFAYIWWKKLHVNTWGGWSVESLQEWGSYMKLAIPSLLMVCFEWWVYEFGGFFAGMLSEDELAAQHAVVMIAFITYMFPLGIQSAACARVGNALGAGDTARALLVSKLSLSLAVSFALVEGVVLGCTKTVIGYLFTADENIARIVSNLMTVYCFLQLFDGLVCVCTGIFLGTGKQRIPAVANFIAYYCVGLTMSVVLMFVAKLRISGFWLGLLICVVLHSTFYIIVIFRLNWKKMTEEAVKRAMKKTHLTLLGADDPSDNRTVHGQPPSNGNFTEGYTPVKTQQHDGNSETRVEQEARRQKSGRLSTTQLVIRRGITMVTALAFLAVGTAVHFLVRLPEIGSNSTLDSVNTTFTPHTIPSLES